MMTKILAAIQAELRVPKGQLNKFGNYKYRSCEDIVEAVKPLLAKHEACLRLSDEIVVMGDRFYVKATARIYVDDAFAEAIAYAREPELKKGMDESQITGTASSYARKYALNGLLAIDDTKDADSNEHANERNTMSNMGGTTIDVNKLQAVVDEAKRIVDEYESDIDSGAKPAREIYEPLSNDERIWVNGQLGSAKRLNKATGKQHAYWAVFKQFLLKAAETDNGI